MDLFNNKKLLEREGEIRELFSQNQRLEATIKELNSELTHLQSKLDRLQLEKDNEAELHQNVVDTMLGEIQEFISANHGTNLSYLSFKTLFPLVKEVLDNHSFLLKIEINHFHYQLFSPASHKDLIVAHCEHIMDVLTGLQMVESSNFDSFEEQDSNVSNRPVLKYQINSRYSMDDFGKKLMLLNTNIFEVKGKPVIKFKDMSVTRDADCVILFLKNVQRRAHRGF